MKRIKQILLTVTILLTTLQTVAQTYPVQSFVQITPPFSSYLPDYADPFNNQMKVLLTLTDFTVPSHQVKIKITMTGNGYSITTNDFLNLPAINLTPGVPVEISGSSLAPYLATENLTFTGIDVNDYTQRKVLPEGPCTICIEVIDYTSPNNTILGNPNCTQAWFTRQQPPMLNQPFCGNNVQDSDPQQILFGWTPMNMGGPTGLTTEYTFELFEDNTNPDHNIDPNQIVNSTLPIFFQITNQTFVNYGIVEPQLQIGKQYIWRVQARNTEGRDLYVNNGYSAVCTFTYGSLAASLADGIELELQTNGTGVRQGYANWNANGVFTNYVLEVRKTGNPNFEWFPYTTAIGVPTADMKINSLEPETEYEARIKGLIGEDYESEYSNISVFTTNPPPNYACGTTTMPATAPNIVPLNIAFMGMVFTVGQFDMFVTSITPLNQPGHFKGTGKIVVPFMLTILNVSFDDILVDDNLTIREGKVEAITDGIDAWEDNILLDLADPYYVDYLDPSTIVVDSSFITVNFEGVDSTLNFPGGGVPIVFNVDGGTQYIVWPDGRIDIGTWGNISDDSLDASENYFVQFEKADGQTYGFDKFNTAHSILASNYENILLNDGSPYYVAYKSTAWNTGDFVVAKLETDNTPVDLTFTIGNEEIDAANINKTDAYTYFIDLSGYMSNFSKDLYAFDDSGLKIGKLRVIAYEEKIIDLVVVPVNSSILNLPNLEEEINAIYACANTKFNVIVDTAFSNTTWDLNGDGAMQIDDPELFNLYSDEMKALKSNYFLDHDRNNQALYLFVIDEFSSQSTDGYMVHNKSLGFLKSNPSARTIAHELGHGAFDLPHTFPQITEGNTDNLMDYGGGTHLTQLQWEQIFTNVLSFSFLDDAEDGELLVLVESKNLQEYAWLNENAITSYNFNSLYTPGGDEIKLNDISKLSNISFDILTGGVSKFKYDGQVYKAYFTKTLIGGGEEGTLKFQGYIRSDYQTYIKDQMASEGINYDSTSHLLRTSNTYITTENITTYYFCEYTFATQGDYVISLISNNSECLKNVFKWESTGSNNITNLNQSENEFYSFPISTILQSLTYGDLDNKDKIMLDNVHGTEDFSPEKLVLFCDLTAIYSSTDDESYHARRYIEKSIYYNSYDNIYDLLDKNIEYLQFLVDMCGHHKALGHELYVQYSLELSKPKLSVFESFLYNESYHQDLTFTENLNRMNTLVNNLHSDLASIENATDDDAIMLILEYKSNSELEKLSVIQRIQALNLLTSGWMFNSEQSLAIRLIDNVLEDSINPFFEEFAVKNGALENLLGVNGYFNSLDHSVKMTFYQTLFSQYKYYENPENKMFLFPLISQNISVDITYEGENIYQLNSDCDPLNSYILQKAEIIDNTVVFDYRYILGHSPFEFTVNGEGLDGSDETEVQGCRNVTLPDLSSPAYKGELSMLTPVIFIDNGSSVLIFNILTTNIDMSIGTAYVVPAFFLSDVKNIESYEGKIELLETVAIILDALTIAKGYPLFSSAFKTVFRSSFTTLRVAARLAECADFLGATSNIAINSIDWSNHPQVESLAVQFNGLIGLLGVSALTGQGYLTVKNFAKNIDLPLVKSQSINYLNSVDDLIKDYNSQWISLDPGIKNKLEMLYNIILRKRIVANAGDALVSSIRARLITLKNPARPILEGEGIPLINGKFTKELGTNKFDNIITGNYGEASKKYIWTIDDNGINIGLEQTSIGNNSVIKHTNLSPKAYSGGEVWFTDIETVHVNAWSGRFGAGANMTKVEWEASIDAWKSLGYKVIIEPYTP